MAYSEITWPVSLPQRPLVDSYGETPDYDVIVTDMDAGPKRQRRPVERGHRVPLSQVSSEMGTEGHDEGFS